MGAHIPVVEEAFNETCVLGECDHENDTECGFKMVVCEGCMNSAEPDAETGYIVLRPWPCIQSTHYPEPMMSNLKKQLLEEAGVTS